MSFLDSKTITSQQFYKTCWRFGRSKLIDPDSESLVLSRVSRNWVLVPLNPEQHPGTFLKELLDPAKVNGFTTWSMLQVSSTWQGCWSLYCCVYVGVERNPPAAPSLQPADAGVWRQDSIFPTVWQLDERCCWCFVKMKRRKSIIIKQYTLCMITFLFLIYFQP